MGRRPGAFSASLSQEDREVQAELLALRGHLPKQLEADEIEDRQKDVLDEAGFVMDENNPLVYVSKNDASRTDGVPYVVTYKKVAIRKIPSTESHVLGALEAGDKLTLFDADVTGAWRKLHYKLKGGYGSLVEAWVMLRHHQLGALVQRADGKSDRVEAKAVSIEAPVAAPAVDASAEEEVDKTARAAALAAEFGERLLLMSAQDVRRFMPTGNRRTFEVVWKPTVAVRTMPHKDALIVTTAEHGLQIDTFGTDETGEWRKVYCSCTSSGREANHDLGLESSHATCAIVAKTLALGAQQGVCMFVYKARRAGDSELDALTLERTFDILIKGEQHGSFRHRAFSLHACRFVSRFSWAVAKLACADAAVTDQLAEEQAARVGEFHAVNLANILWANAKLLNKSEKLVDSLLAA
ncbi:IRX7 [Symbiodinium sp. CCMP2456]|nr:IRX7 [Symbiodinium sp. CCMP2456]